MSTKKISKAQVEHIAKLAKIGLTPEEISKYEEQLSGILEYVDQLNELDTKTVTPTYQVTGLKNVWQEDEVLPSLSQEEALQNAPLKQNGYFKIKKVL